VTRYEYKVIDTGEDVDEELDALGVCGRCSQRAESRHPVAPAPLHVTDRIRRRESP
jgi:hypothetical protein